MPLINFGSILGFAEDMETEQMAFFTHAAKDPACAEYHAMANALAKSAGKRIKEVQRVRRENVTEMILETIQDFTRKPFLLENLERSDLDSKNFTPRARAMVDRAIHYYDAAAEKLKGQADVSRALKILAKKQGKDRKELAKG
jgi:hypothetical protein